ncbi:MAG: maleylpyruvate isomerase N-terminal domain-containing protein [Acidimicrobiales bacterium]
MSAEPVAARPSEGIATEAEAFLEALEVTPPDALTGCAEWRAHEVAAHLSAGAVEIALNLEAYGEGRPVPATRGFEEREAPYRAMGNADLRAVLPRSIERVAAALDAVLGAEPDAVVPWTGRQMAVATFVTHLRSELAIHRFDLIGDDETGTTLLGQPELTDHAVAVLGRALVSRGAGSAPVGFSAVVAAPGASDVVVLVDGDGPRLERRETAADPAVVGDPAARLLFIWGRRPGDPRRLAAPQGAEVLGQLEALLAGY